MKLYNKKGFTLVEIITVIVLLSIILIISIPGIDKLSKAMKQNTLEKKERLIEQAAVLWGQDNKSILNSDLNCFVNEYETKEVTTGNKMKVNKLYDCHKVI